MKINVSAQLKPLGSNSPLVFISKSVDSNSLPHSSLVTNEEQVFGNIVVSLKSLGNTQYRIEWFSKMTGATTSIAKMGVNNYAVFRKWAQVKKLPDVSHPFTKRKTALVHFLNNVDIIRSTDNVMSEAKNYCLKLFSKQEDVIIPDNHKFTRYRLQGAIGRPVQIRAKRNSDIVIADGILLQLIGDKAEIQVLKSHGLINKKPVQKFPNYLVFVN